MAPESGFSLGADFAPATRAQWRGLVAQVLARSRVGTGNTGGSADPAVPELALATPTYDGFDLRPLYTADDRPPGFEWPGPVRRENSGTGWDVRQRHHDTDPGAVNRAVHADLGNGVNSIWLDIGAGALTVADLAGALAGVDLEQTPIVLSAGEFGDAAARALLALTNGRTLAGSLGLDPVATRARTGAPIENAGLGNLAATAGLVLDHPRLAAVTVDATVYHDAGGSDAQEIGLAAGAGVACVRALTESGWSVADAFAHTECRYAVTADQFASIAKLRAARRVWSRVGELCGLADTAHRQHAVTSRAMLTRRDPWVNLLRATLATFAAATAGADVITVEPFDAAIGYSDEFGRRIARNTQSILRDESYLARVDDPGAGSWYLESRTESVAQAAWSIFLEIERAGGAMVALENGLTPQLLADTRLRRADAIAHRREPITGVSEFAFPGEEPVVRVRRATGPAESAVSAVSAVPLLPAIRYAQDFEALRDRADAAIARPTIFLAALGSPAQSGARLDFARNLFNAGGIESVVGYGDPAEIRRAFEAFDGPLVCLCSSDPVYSDPGAGAAPTAAALFAAGASLIWLAGRPGERAESDLAAGISAHLYSGGNALETLERALDALGVAR